MTTHTPIESRITNELAADLFTPSMTTLDICRRHGISIPDLAAITETAWFRENADALERAEQRRAAALAPDRRERALSTLDAIAAETPTTPTHAECVRRAAAAVLRHTTPKPDPRPGNETRSQSEPRASARAAPKEPTPLNDSTPNTTNTEATTDTQPPPDQSQTPAPTPETQPLPAPSEAEAPEPSQPLRALRDLRVEDSSSPSLSALSA